MLGLDNFPHKRDISFTSQYLQDFESDIAVNYEAGNVRGPVHLSDGNEEQLISIFSKISKDDFVFSAWRNHYHALLHGVPPDYLKTEITEGRSMGIVYKTPDFYSSSIVAGIIPIALGTAIAISIKHNNDKRVWCFIGDMTYETGLFWESYKMAQNHNLPLTFIIEDNSKSVTTDTEKCWNGKMKPLNGVLYYSYKSKYPHHGTGKWVNF